MFNCRMRKVGWIFTQTAAERDYILDSQEIQAMAAIQGEMGEGAVTGVVSTSASQGDAEIHFEVCSLLCVDTAAYTAYTSTCACSSNIFRQEKVLLPVSVTQAPLRGMLRTTLRSAPPFACSAELGASVDIGCECRHI